MVDNIETWKKGVREAVLEFFGPDSRNTLALSDTVGFAELSLQSAIEDDGGFVDLLPKNTHRSWRPKYSETGETRWVLELHPRSTEESAPAAAVVVAKPASPYKTHLVGIVSNLILICVAVVVLKMFYSDTSSPPNEPK